MAEPRYTFEAPAGEQSRKFVDFIPNIYRRLLAAASEDFKACWLAGVEMKSEYKDGVMTMRTVPKCGVVRNPDGTTVVYVMPKPSNTGIAGAEARERCKSLIPSSEMRTEFRPGTPKDWPVP